MKGIWLCGGVALSCCTAQREAWPPHRSNSAVQHSDKGSMILSADWSFCSILHSHVIFSSSDFLEPITLVQLASICCNITDRRKIREDACRKQPPTTCLNYVTALLLVYLSASPWSVVKTSLEQEFKKANGQIHSGRDDTCVILKAGVCGEWLDEWSSGTGSNGGLGSYLLARVTVFIAAKYYSL